MPDKHRDRIDKLLGRIPSVANRLEGMLPQKEGVPDFRSTPLERIKDARNEREAVRLLTRHKASESRRGF